MVSGFGHVLWRRKLVIIACIGLVLGLTAAYVSTLPRAYEATALVAVGPGQQLGRAASGPAGSLEDQLRLIESRTMAERLVGRLGLHLLPEFRPAAAGGFRIGDLLPDAILDRLPTAWAAALASRPADLALTDEQRAAQLREEVVAATMKRIRAELASPSTMALKFTSADPQLAATGASALAELYLGEPGTLRQTSPGNDRARLEQELERLRAGIRETEQAIEAARARAQAQASATGAQSLLDLTGELGFWRSERAELEVRLRQTQAALESGGSLDQVALALDSDRLNQLQARAVELEQALAALSHQYGEEDAQTVELRAELAALEQERRAELEDLVQRMQQELAIIQSRESALAARIAELEEQSPQGQPADDIAILERRLAAERAALRGYLEQAAREPGSRSPGSETPAITPAVAPAGPTYARLALIWAVASAGALLLGIVLALAFETLRHERA